MSDVVSEKEEKNYSFGLELGDITTLFGVIAGTSIALSVFYEYGYFWAVDIRLLRLFTFQDALGSAFHSLVSGILALAFILVLNNLDFLVLGFRLSESRSQKLVSRILRFIAVGTAILGFFFADERIMSAFIITIFLYSLLASGLMRRVGGNSVMKQKVFMVYFAIGIAFLSFSWGEISGSGDLKSPRRDYLIRTEDGVRAVLVMWAGSDSVLVREDPRKVSVISRSDIKEIVALSVHREMRWLSFPGLLGWQPSSQPSLPTRGR